MEGKKQVDFKCLTHEPRIFDVETERRNPRNPNAAPASLNLSKSKQAGLRENYPLRTLPADFYEHTNDRCRARWMRNIHITLDLARRRDIAQRLSKPVDR